MNQFTGGSFTSPFLLQERGFKVYIKDINISVKKQCEVTIQYVSSSELLPRVHYVL